MATASSSSAAPITGSQTPWFPTSTPQTRNSIAQSNTAFNNWTFYVIRIRASSKISQYNSEHYLKPPYSFAEAVSMSQEEENWGVTTYPLVAEYLTRTQDFSVEFVTDADPLAHPPRRIKTPKFLANGNEQSIIRHLEQNPLLFGFHQLAMVQLDGPSLIKNNPVIEFYRGKPHYIGITGNVIRWMASIDKFEQEKAYVAKVDEYPDFPQVHQAILKIYDDLTEAYHTYYHTGNHAAKINEWMRNFKHQKARFKRTFKRLRNSDDPEIAMVIKAIHELARWGTTQTPFEMVYEQTKFQNLKTLDPKGLLMDVPGQHRSNTESC